MRSALRANAMDVVNNQKINTYVNLGKKSADNVEDSPPSRILISEGSAYFSEYIEEEGLAGDPNIIVLSSHHHYYYDADEIKNVKTVINLKELNQVKELKILLQSVYQLLPPGSNFIGCFVDNRKFNAFETRNHLSSSRKQAEHEDLEENGIVSNIPFINMIYSFMDLRTNKYMSARSVKETLRDNRFKVLNMKEINGLTYFHAQKSGSDDT
jgi:hypothetical protein